MKKVFVMFLLAACLLTGCAQKDTLLNYAEFDGLGMLDSEAEIVEASEKMIKLDQGKWSYRQENIQAVLNLEKKIKETCTSEKVKITVYYNNSENDSAEVWARHAKEGKDPRKENVSDMNIQLEMKDQAAVKTTCQKLADLGFSRLREYKSGSISLVQNGYFVDVFGEVDTEGEEYDEEYEEEEYPYSIQIQISGMMAFGPERYFDLIDSCLSNDLYIWKFICCNGALDGIVLRSENVWVNAYLKNDKVLEINVSRDSWKQGSFFAEQEQKGMVELLTRMCGDRNAAISMIRELTKDGKSEGTVGDCKWYVKKDTSVNTDSEASYILRII